MYKERRPHLVSTRLTETDLQTLEQWCDLTMRRPGDLLNTVLRRIFALRRKHPSGQQVDEFVRRLELKPAISDRQSRKLQSNGALRKPLPKREQAPFARATRRRAT